MPRLTRTAQRAALLELGGIVAGELRAGVTGNGTRTVGDVLSGMPGAVLDLMALIEREASKKRPDDDLLAAFAFIAGQALENLRYGLERADPAASEMLGTVQQRLVTLARSDRSDRTVLMLLAKQFASAKLDIGEALRDAMGDIVAEEAEAAQGSFGTDMDLDLAALGRDLNDDPYAIHLELAETAASLPVGHRMALAHAVLASTSPSVREAALGWLLDPEPDIRVAVAEALNEEAKTGRLSAAALRRLIALRNWLPAADREPLDIAIRTARRKGLEPDAAAPAKFFGILASAFDGSGAGSMFATMRSGRHYVVASLLLKLGMGVRDAWVQRDLTKEQAATLLSEIADQIDLVPISAEVLRRSVPHFLSVNATTGLLPPFSTLDVIEAAGLGTVNPQALPVEAILSEILGDVPETAAIEEALAESAVWIAQYGAMDSWFEDGAPVEAVLKGRKGLSQLRKVELVMGQVIAPQRRRWGEMLGWTALISFDAGDKEVAHAFALVAREMLGDRPVVEIPLFRSIAEATIAARRRRWA